MAIFISGVGYTVNPSPLAISEGGTGQSTAPLAINALLPTQSGQNTKVLGTDGTNVSWVTAGGGGTPGGSTTQIQYNNAGAFAGSSRFTWDNTATAPVLTLTSNAATTATITAGDTGGQNHLRIKAGTPASGDGGNLYLNATDCGTSTSNGGDIQIIAGRTGLNAANAGTVIIRSGSAPSSSTTGYIQLSSTVNDTPTPRLTINYDGSWSLGAAGTNKGTSGQVLTSNGTTTAPTWQNVSASTATNISGGATGQIPFQSAASTTTFSAGLAYSTVSNPTLTVGIGTLGLSILNAGDGASPNSLTVRAGDSSGGNTGGNMTVAGGLSAGNAGGYVYLKTAGSTGPLATRMTVTNNGNVITGDGVTALGTSATRGYFYITAGAGTPSASPLIDAGGTAGTTQVPLHTDTTNNLLYFYSSGAWRTPGGAAGSNTQIQYNNAGALAGSSFLTLNGTTGAFNYVGGSVATPANVTWTTSTSTTASPGASFTVNAGGNIGGGGGGNGGDVNFYGGTVSGGNGTGGSALLQAGAGFGTNAGGTAGLRAGNGGTGTGGTGGTVTIAAGSAGTTSVAGGGTIIIVAGNTGNGSTSTTGGDVRIDSGYSTSGSSQGGSIILRTAQTTFNSVTERFRITTTGALAIAGAANYGTSGQVLTSAGNAAPSWQTAAAAAAGTLTGTTLAANVVNASLTTVVPATAGTSLSLSGAGSTVNTGTAGAVTIAGGNGTVNTVFGGAVTITAGNGNNRVGGAITITSGTDIITNNFGSGAVTIGSGVATGGVAQASGIVTIQSGTSNGFGGTGALNLLTGDATAGGGGSTAGNITIAPGTGTIAGGSIIFRTAATTTLGTRMTISPAGNVSVGIPSLATTATNGFPYFPTCAGLPTGVPTAITGFAPVVIDSTNSKMYFYSGGAWVALN